MEIDLEQFLGCSTACFRE